MKKSANNRSVSNILTSVRSKETSFVLLTFLKSIFPFRRLALFSFSVFQPLAALFIDREVLSGIERTLASEERFLNLIESLKEE